MTASDQERFPPDAKDGRELPGRHRAGTTSGSAEPASPTARAAI